MAAAPHVLIVGAGLAGLACARCLTKAGATCTIFEGSDGVGGRARTDPLRGFRLDRGFQIFLTGYPEARRSLDYAALDLQPFHAGAIIRYGGRFHLLSDLLRRPQDLVSTVFSPIGSLKDKLLLLRLRLDALGGKLCSSAQRHKLSTREVLENYGFSDSMRTRFFHPFLSGVFLETELTTPCWVFELVWAAFCRGAAALPRDGMGAIARQLADALPAGTIRLNQPVRRVEGSTVVLKSDERLTGDGVVVATDDATASQLRGEPSSHGAGRWSTTLYFDAPAAPHRGPWLMLNGEGDGLARTVCVLSEAAPSYAPRGRALISVTVRERPESSDGLAQAVQADLRSWFGSHVEHWGHLRTDHIRYALPPVDLLSPTGHADSARVADGLYLCGDYRESGTLDGALLSGRKAAEAVLADYTSV